MADFVEKFGFGQVGQVIQVSSFDLSHFLRIRSVKQVFGGLQKNKQLLFFFEICFLR